MLEDGVTLGDKPTDIDPRFKEPIDGVILICGDSHGTVRKQLVQIKQLFSVGTKQAIVSQKLVLSGDVRTRPGQKGHEQYVSCHAVAELMLLTGRAALDSWMEYLNLLLKEFILLRGRMSRSRFHKGMCFRSKLVGTWFQIAD
jgi:hypothetical protein